MYRCPCWNLDDTRCEVVTPEGVCTEHRKDFQVHIKCEKYLKDISFSPEYEDLVSRLMRVKMLEYKKIFEHNLDIFRNFVEREEAKVFSPQINFDSHCC